MKKLLIIILLFSTQAFAVWTVKNDKQLFNGSASSVSVTFDNALTNPSTIVAVCRTRNGIADAGAHDSNGTFTYSGLDIDTGQAFASVLTIFLIANTHTTANDVVTCTGSNVSTEAFEVTGGPAGAYFIDGSAITGSVSTLPPGANNIVFPSPFTTTQNGDFVFATIITSFSPWTAGTSPNVFTLMPAPIALAVSEYTTQTSHGAIAPTYGSSSSGTFGGIAFALKPTGPAISVSRHTGFMF